jgi:hypothetical protein
MTPNPLVVDIDVAREAINQAERNMTEATAAWQEKEARYRLMVRELAYRLTIGMEEMIVLNMLRMVGMDEELIQAVLTQHDERREKDAQNA